MCPIETPEGPNIGLIGSLASYGRINAFGFVETPYRKVVDGQVTDEVDYLTADEEDEYVIAQANAPLTPDSHFAEERVLVRTKGGEVEYVPGDDVDYMDVSPRQMVSVATALIPFLEHDDANRALMGANMKRQAVPLVRPRRRWSAPAWSTAPRSTPVTWSGPRRPVWSPRSPPTSSPSPTTTAPTSTYRVAKFSPLQPGHLRTTSACSSTRATASRSVGVIADGPATDDGEMALGKNLLVAFMPWEGHNYEDAIILSQRLVQDDVLSSIHIEEHEVDARDTKLGPGGDHPGHPERLRGGPGRPRRARHHPHRCRGPRRRHPGRQGHAQGRDRADPGGAPAARDLRREGPRGPRHVPEGAPRRDRHGHRRQGLRP